MTPLDHLVLAVHDGDLDVPIKGAARLIREAVARGLISNEPTDNQGRTHKYPVRLTKDGIKHLRKLGLVRPGESAG